MSLLLRILGVVLIVIGCVWFFQGIGVLPGSFMSGQGEWAVYGVLVELGGLALLVLARRGRLRRRQDT